MAALACDICGGKLSMGSGGIAVCDSCGMEHTKERMQEKVQEIKGVVRVDNSHMIENYLGMAQNAFDSSNQAEAESYCNKVIEIDPNNYQAWLLKGKSAGWQSTLQSPRFSETVSCFSKAIVNSPGDERDELIEATKADIRDLAMALISIRSDRFTKWPDEDEAAGFTADISKIADAMQLFIQQAGVIIPLSEMMAPLAVLVTQSVTKAWQNIILPDYKGNNDKPDEYQWKKFIGRIGYCTDLIQSAIRWCDDDDEEDIPRYENLIFLHNQAINSCSWDTEYFEFHRYFQERENREKYTQAAIAAAQANGLIPDAENDRVWFKKYNLSDSAIAGRRTLISEYQRKISSFKAENARKAKELSEKRFTEYWEEHANERQSLEAEKQLLSDQIKELSDEISRIPEQAELTNLNSRYTQLSGEKAALSLFKNKEKKAIQEQMDTVNSEISRVKSKLDSAVSEIRNRRTQLEARLRDIENELKKGR